jgi:hypothetical protein
MLMPRVGDGVGSGMTVIKGCDRPFEVFQSETDCFGMKQPRA